MGIRLGYRNAFTAACIAMLVHVTTSWVIAFAMLGAGVAVIDAVQRALIADLSPPHLRATAMGAYYAAIALVALPGGTRAARWIAMLSRPVPTVLAWTNLRP